MLGREGRLLRYLRISAFEENDRGGLVWQRATLAVSAKQRVGLGKRDDRF